MWPDIDAINEAWEHGDGSGVTVAILDSGIDQAHPALAGAEFARPQEVTYSNHEPRVDRCEPVDLEGHGTGIAGIVHSLAPRARLLSIRVLNKDKLQYRHPIISAGAWAAIEEGAHILNCSFGAPGHSSILQFYKPWTDHAFTHGRHVVVAASNADPDKLHWPASFPQVLSVSAGLLPAGALRHRPGRLVSFEGPGVDIPLLAPGGKTVVRTGCSYAAAHLSGLLARLLSRHPDLSPSFAQEALRAIATGTAPAQGSNKI